MADTKYVVELDLRKLGDFGLEKSARSAEKVEDRFKSMKQGFATLGGQANSFIGVLDSIVVKAAKVGLTFGAIGVGGGIAAATWGVTHLNNQLEQAQISIGTIFSVSGFAADVPRGITMAADTIEKMRVSAKQLPGEFEDLQRIFLTGAIPAFHSGLDPKKWEALAAQVMAASKVASVPMDQAAREFAMLMEGRSGAHNVVGMRLLGLSGDKAEAFNKKSAADRVQILTTELNKYEGSINEFGKSYDALSSTFMDNVKDFTRTASGPLFDAVKSTLIDVNGWFDKNQSKIDKWARMLGYKLEGAFAWGREQIEHWGPLVLDFAETAYDRFMRFWQDVEPYAQSVAEYLQKALEDPNGTIDKLLDLMKMYAALKVGQGVVQTGVGIAQTGGAIAQIASYFGAGAAAGGAGAGAAAGGGGMLAKLGGMLGAGGLGGYALAGGIPTAIAGSLYYGAFGGVDSRAEHDDANRLAGKRYADKKFDEWADSGMTLSEMFAQVEKESAYLKAQYQPLAAEMLELEGAARHAASVLGQLDPNSGRGGFSWEDTEPEQKFDDWMREKNEGFFNPINALIEGARNNMAKDAHKPKHKGGAGGTMKVEITITSNQDPDRIARLAVDKLEGLARRRTVSAFQPYSRVSGG